MSEPQRFLVALDLSEEADQVLEKAQLLANTFKAQLHLLHVVEPIIGDSNYFMPGTYMEVEEALQRRADEFLQKKISDYKLSGAEYSVRLGSVKSEIFRLVEEKGVKLIVIGTHGRHGVGLLLGSTANAVLHGTPCDVYVAKIE